MDMNIEALDKKRIKLLELHLVGFFLFLVFSTTRFFFRSGDLNSMAIGNAVLAGAILGVLIISFSTLRLGMLHNQIKTNPALKEALYNELVRTIACESWRAAYIGAAASTVFFAIVCFFYPIYDLYDTITFEDSDQFSFTSSNSKITSDSSNLIISALTSIEQIINKKLIEDLKGLGIWVSAQPNFAGRWSVPGGLNEHRLGSNRLARCNAYKTFLDNDIPLVFGSDSMPLNPLFGIKSAIFHPVQGQRISPKEAVKAYTQSCYSLLKLNSKFGSLIPGKVADIVILSHDPFVVSENDFDEIKVAGTIIDGEVVYCDLDLLEFE